MKEDLTDPHKFTIVRVSDDSESPCEGCYFVNEVTEQCTAPNIFQTA